ncbi:MAG: DNA polymerase I [Acidimicrobiia bacterium]|nr:DNA polymerase I [Acidimicrobiia bacterium]
MPKLALLDGHSLAYRAFYALPTDLATPDGRVTNAVFGFTSMIIKLLGDEHPDALAVCWDTPEKTFRSEEFPEYKAQREAAPDLFRSQLPLMREVADALRFTQVEAPGFEADDVIATLAKDAAEDGWDVLIVTGDRDSFQVVGGPVRVYYTRRGISDTIVVDPSYVEERYGVRPEQYVDYAALRGDSSDNLPGVPGVGEKTATKLVAGYGSLEGIYEHLEEQTPKLKENLAEYRDQVFLNRRLSRLLDDVEVDVTPEDLRLEPWDPGEVREVFDALAFRSLWQRLQEVGGAAEASPDAVLEVEVSTARSEDSVAALVEGTLALEPVWDAEGDLVGVAVAAEDEAATFVTAEDLGPIADALADPDVPKALHDGKRLMRALFEADLGFRGLAFDTALAGYVINPAERAPDLHDLAGRVLGLEIEPAEEADAGGGGAQGAFDFEGSGPDLEAAGRRAVAIARLVEPLTEQLDARGSRELFEGIELPLARVLALMEVEGIAVDTAYLEELRESLRDRLATLEKQIYDAAGEPFNVNSTLQLREVLFERLGLPVTKKTPKGAPSTDASVLEKLADEHPIAEQLLRYRELEKLRSTYVDGLLPLVAPDGRIHCVFNQTGAATGRISSERPNMQNIPVRSEEGRTIRRAFVAAPEHRFVVADYSQIELRILAHLSGDPGLVEAFTTGQDIHTATAARVWDVPVDDVDPDLRRRAKVINFGLLYGMEAYGLAQRLEIGTDEAQEHMDAYFAQFPEVGAFMEGIVERARNEGYTTTLLGRRRYLPELSSGNYRVRQMGERMALNAPIQGSAADIIKKAMIALQDELEARGMRTAMLLQVHDELVIEAPDDEVEAAVDLTREIMEGIVELDVPLRVDVGTGTTLGDAKA